MKRWIPLLAFVWLYTFSQAQTNPASRLRGQFVHDTNVMVIAHRGHWRYAPENSLLALQHAIEIGVDIVEIDLKITSDHHLVLMHDNTLDRTTTGTGRVADHTLAEIKTLYLKDGANHKTEYRVPTLEEALSVCKDRVLVNLDKAFDYFQWVYPILQQTHTQKQIILKGYNKSYQQVINKIGTHIDSLLYMPIITLGKPHYQELVDELKDHPYPAVEFTFDTDTFAVINTFPAIAAAGTRVWVNALYPEHNAGHHDDRALTDPNGSYGWLIEKGINLIQTDRPEQLLHYLHTRGLHNE